MSLTSLLRLPWRGEHAAAEDDDGDEAWFNAPTYIRDSLHYRALVWSTDIPTLPGWYWFRDPDQPDHLDVFELKVGQRCVDDGLFQYAGPVPTPYEAVER